MSIGKNIKKCRLDQGLSQRELAERLNTSQQMVAAYENDKRNPKIETISKIANALNVQLDQIVSRHTNRTIHDLIHMVSYPNGTIITLDQVLNDLINGNKEVISDINSYMNKKGYNDFEINGILNGSVILDCNSENDCKIYECLESYFNYDLCIMIYLDFAFHNKPVQQEIFDRLNYNTYLNYDYISYLQNPHPQSKSSRKLSKKTIEYMDKRMETKKEYIVNTYNSLNYTGKERLFEFAEMLSKIDEYKKDDD